MRDVKVRTSLTSKGTLSITPWSPKEYIYALTQLILGTNPISSIEIVSALNSFNLGRWEYHYDYRNCPERYYPKVYLSAIQTMSTQWDYDYQNPEKVDPKWALAGGQKSGSWPQKNILTWRM